MRPRTAAVLFAAAVAVAIVAAAPVYADITNNLHLAGERTSPDQLILP